MARNNFGRGGMGGMGGMGNIQQAIRQAQKMQEDMARMQEELQAQEFEASAGGGMVTAKATGDRKIQSIQIKPEAVDPDDVEMLQDLVVAAVNAVMEKIEQTTQSEMNRVTGGMNIPGMR
nr:YbaB/EbfC family nucleoid-associated protein [Maliibacterium massiliense]